MITLEEVVLAKGSELSKGDVLRVLKRTTVDPRIKEKGVRIEHLSSRIRERFDCDYQIKE